MWHVPSVSALLLAVFSTPAAAQSVHPAQLEYALAVIEHLADRPGRFTCVFYDMLHRTDPGTLLRHLLTSPRLDRVAKLLVNQHFPFPEIEKLPEKPSLMVVFIGSCGWSCDEPLGYFHQHTKILVLVDCRHSRCFRDVTADLSECVQEFYFNKVVCVGRQPPIVAQRQLDGETWSPETYYPDPAKLFVDDHVRKLNGRKVTYSCPMDGCNMLLGESEGKWLTETARYLNATVLFVPSGCIIGQTNWNDCYGEHMISNKIDFELQTRAAKNQVAANHWIHDPRPHASHLMVPMGRKLNVFELFVVPFAWESWLVVIGLLVATELINALFPAVFHNDPILLVVCGFERFNLHRAGRLEKIALHTLIVVFFLLTSAYEIKIITLMTTKPSLGTPRTIADLQAANIPILVDLRFHAYMAHHPTIGNLVIDEAGSLPNVKYAMVLFTRYRKEYEKHQPYLVRRRLMAGYTVMQDPLEIQLLVYYIRQRSPLLEGFQRTLNIFCESGNTEFWIANGMRLADSIYRQYGGEIKIQQPLRVRDVVPAFIALAFGLAIAGTAWLVEIGTPRLSRFVNKKRALGWRSRC